MGTERESIRAVATVTLDAAALEGLGPRTIDRLADLVASRLEARRAAAEEPLLSSVDAGRLAGVHPETVRRAIRSGELEVAGYIGSRPRMRREAVEAWIASGRRPSMVPMTTTGAVTRRGRSARRRRVLGDALLGLDAIGERAA